MAHHRLVIVLYMMLSLCGCPDAAETTSPSSSSDAGSEPVSQLQDAGGSGAPPPPSDAGGPEVAADAGPTEAVELERESLPEAELVPSTLPEQRAAMLRRMRAMDVANTEQVSALEAIFQKAPRIGQGRPSATKYAMTRTACMQRRQGVGDARKPACRAPFMAPLYNPSKQSEKDAKVCIDRFEFPGLPCEYPMTWVSTKQAQSICKVLGKRLCDAHEWEGACAGALRPPETEYKFGLTRHAMRKLHNARRDIVWAYGSERDLTRCATGSKKTPRCGLGGHCGSNTYPAGAFPECRSPLGVYDLHGNAAEHMALPLHALQLGAQGGFGVPEMKGSWFVFQHIDAHKDDCRWRAPAWHDDEGKNHANYHLGFRCCKDV